ncbi:hypothetical protein [Moorena sp. SIO4A5]|uniref:hypothetical protein n=1 Tax=Moorena sp. SIO4A5 TaxID=2607838 RepID=UPI0013CB9FB6|nr:hypothetical protein [Moorena sp. SIO4A5]NEO20570.1 hypothetical protein [Moorena sp. SIO4A5]
MTNIALATANEDLKPGQVRFYAAAEPPLQAGGYQFLAEQTVEGLKSQPDNNHFGTQSPFVVTGPRFRLPPQDLQSVYPPANEVGDYEESLCHVVLRTRTLPWVRTIDGSTNSRGDADGTVPPWLALLTVYPEEINGTQPITITVNDLIDPGDGSILPPTLIDAADLTEEERNSQLLAVDLDLGVFQAISPSLVELPFLAHVREVNTDQKEVLNMLEDGWFSVVVGNRLPKTNAENICFLVSLEGHQDHLHGNSGIPSNFTKIRLVVLARWAFTAAASRGSFLYYMQNLCERGGIDLLQPTHTAFPSPEGDSVTQQAQTAVQEALEIGYIPLQNTTRTGEVTTSWYRGPLTPVPTKPDTLGPYFFSDRAIRYDPETGLFNMAFASAWQIGQLLALSDAAFARALFEWRLNYYQQQHGAVAEEHLQQLTIQPTLQMGQIPKTEVTPILLSAMNLLSQMVTVPTQPRASIQAQTSTPAKRINLVQPHHCRDQATGQLPGVIDSNLWQSQLTAGNDALHLLFQHLQHPLTEDT